MTQRNPEKHYGDPYCAGYVADPPEKIHEAEVETPHLSLEELVYLPSAKLRVQTPTMGELAQAFLDQQKANDDAAIDKPSDIL